MAQVTISLNGRDYTVGCGPGEEARIKELARGIDARIRELIGQIGQVGEARLLVMALLTMADEMSEGQGGSIANGHGGGGRGEAGAEVAAGIAALAQRVAAVAERLESAKI
jgi:cell division protein ZapA